MTMHNEAQADEIFVGNASRNSDRVADLRASGVRSARFGDVAYCIKGKPLSHDLAPVLIARNEAGIYDDVMMTRTFGPDWRRNR